MTEFLELDGGRLAYDVTGEGPLIVLAHGMGDNRAAYREVATLLAGAGYRVTCVDQRGHGESSTGWASYTRTDSAADLLAVIRHLGGPAVLVGHSFTGGSVTIAAAQEPESVSAIVGISPFTRAQKVDFGGLSPMPATARVWRCSWARACCAASGCGSATSTTPTPAPSPRASPITSPRSTPTCAGPAGWRWWAGWACPRPPTRAPGSATSGAPRWSSKARWTPTGPMPAPRARASWRPCRRGWAGSR